jgi:hypothetical protein
MQYKETKIIGDDIYSGYRHLRFYTNATHASAQTIKTLT